MGAPAAPDAIILALTPKAQHILLRLILERETSRFEEVEKDDDEDLEEGEGREKWRG